METNPMTSPLEVESRSLVNDSVNSGVATQFWLELVAYPQGTARSLWMFVENSWRRLDYPWESVQRSVQDAFNHSDKFEVIVWFDAQEVVGLVVRSK